MNEITTAGDWQGLRAAHRWQIPARYNRAWDMCEKWAEAEPGRLALVYLRPDGEVREYSFAQLSRASNRFANALAGHGVTRGEAALPLGVDFVDKVRLALPTPPIVWGGALV